VSSWEMSETKRLRETNLCRGVGESGTEEEEEEESAGGEEGERRGSDGGGVQLHEVEGSECGQRV
jgi:hypothetical protein